MLGRAGLVAAGWPPGSLFVLRYYAVATHYAANLWEPVTALCLAGLRLVATGWPPGSLGATHDLLNRGEPMAALCLAGLGLVTA